MIAVHERIVYSAVFGENLGEEDVDKTTFDVPADGGWRRHCEILNFEQHVDVRRELDSFTVGKT